MYYQDHCCWLFTLCLLPTQHLCFDMRNIALRRSIHCMVEEVSTPYFLHAMGYGYIGYSGIPVTSRFVGCIISEANLLFVITLGYTQNDTTWFLYTTLVFRLELAPLFSGKWGKCALFTRGGREMMERWRRKLCHTHILMQINEVLSGGYDPAGAYLNSYTSFYLFV